MTDMFEVDVAEVDGVRVRIFRHAPPNLLAVWQGSRAHGDRDFLVYEGERYTYATSHRAVGALAHRLAEHGVGMGDRVAIAMRNYPEWAFAFWATVALGAVAVPLNAWWTGPELAYGLADSGSRALVADGERLERLRPHYGELPDLRMVVVARAPVDDAREEPFPAIPDRDPPPLPEVSVGPDDDLTILYTSGTTGRPKGAVGTHRNMCNFLMQGFYLAAQRAAEIAEAAEAAQGAAGQPATSETVEPAPPSTLLTFPLFHVGGLQSHLVPYTAYGGKLVLMYRWDAAQAVDLIQREEIVNVSGVPTTMFSLLEAATDRGVDLASLSGISSGATLVPPELVRRIDGQFASRVAPGNGYGLTETSGAVTFNGGADYVARPESVGRPLSPVIELRVAGLAGEELPTGATGEVWVKGPVVVRGYWNNPEATAASFTAGWFRTGDIGFIDPDGYLHIVDRAKDVVIRGGENVYSAEVEAALFEHPDVADAAIIGLPHQQLGEEVAAVVRLRPDSATTAEDLQSHVGERLAAFKVPSRVFVWNGELPRNAAGKVLKRELREQLTKEVVT